MDNLCEITDDESDGGQESETRVALKRLDSIEAIADNERPSVARVASNLDSLSPVMATCSSLATSPLSSPSTSRSSAPQQIIRSQMRRDFLRLLSSLHKRNVAIKMYECPIELCANFDGCNAEFTHLFVNKLQTPIGVEKSALIRTSDVIELVFKIDDNSKA